MFVERPGESTTPLLVAFRTGSPDLLRWSARLLCSSGPGVCASDRMRAVRVVHYRPGRGQHSVRAPAVPVINTGKTSLSPALRSSSRQSFVWPSGTISRSPTRSSRSGSGKRKTGWPQIGSNSGKRIRLSPPRSVESRPERRRKRGSGNLIRSADAVVRGLRLRHRDPKSPGVASGGGKRRKP